MKTWGKKFIALAAPSGGGKTTLCRMLLSKYAQTCLSISFTTRPPRGNEKEGKDYFFVSHDKFQTLISSGALVEWAQVHGHLYGTGKEFLEERSRAGFVVVLDIDVQGVESLKAVYGDKCLSVFVFPPSMEELEDRLRARNTEPEEKIQQRMRAAASEISRANDFDHKIVNNDLSESFAELCQLVEREVGLGK